MNGGKGIPKLWRNLGSIILIEKYFWNRGWDISFLDFHGCEMEGNRVTGQILIHVPLKWLHLSQGWTCVVQVNEEAWLVWGSLHPTSSWSGFGIQQTMELTWIIEVFPFGERLFHYPWFWVHYMGLVSICDIFS